jgi:hypothetical protein
MADWVVQKWCQLLKHSVGQRTSFEWQFEVPCRNVAASARSFAPRSTPHSDLASQQDHQKRTLLAARWPEIEGLGMLEEQALALEKVLFPQVP